MPDKPPSQSFLKGWSRPQNHYFYGSTNDSADIGQRNNVNQSNPDEQESLIGEGLIHEEDYENTPRSSGHDLQQLVIARTHSNGGGENGGTGSASGAGSGSVVIGSTATYQSNQHLHDNINKHHHHHHHHSEEATWVVPQPDKGTPQISNPLGISRVVLVIALSVFMGVLLIVLFPHAASPDIKTSVGPTVVIPFPHVYREDYGDPVNQVLDLDLFHPSLFSAREERQFIFPFPTGAFWTNLIVPSPDPTYSYPIAVYPYAYKWSKTNIQVSYPFHHRLQKPRLIIDPFVPELTFSVKEEILRRFVFRYDPMSVSLRYITAQKESKWESYLVQGSPYVTLKYLSATPVIRALSIFSSVQCPGDDDEMMDDFIQADEEDDDEAAGSSTRRQLYGVCSVNDDNQNETILRGVQFIFKSQEGLNWIMFASEPMTLVFDAIRKTTVIASEPFTGVIRVALIPSEPDDDLSASSASAITTAKTPVQVDASSGLRRLIYHASIYPIGGDVSWDFAKPALTNQNATGTVRFSYTTRAMTDAAIRRNGPKIRLLMLALPHHAELLPTKNQLRTKKQFDLTYTCIKGNMTPVVGSTWIYEEPLLSVKFENFPLPSPRSKNIQSLIIDQVDKDLTRVLPTRTENVYGFGKQVARLAQLAYMTDMLLGKNATQSDLDILDKATNLLWYYLDLFLSGQVTDHLLFDSNLGGLVTINGLYNHEEDFGNGRYNDHHFHYGYILYACAVMGKLNDTFVDTYGDHVDSIYLDVAHSTNRDSRGSSTNAFFPLTRHMSWFDSHSFASGLFPFGNGKSQESSSEAVNCYYGAYLWSLVRRQFTPTASIAKETDFARLLLSMEVRGAKTYWHMVPSLDTSAAATNDTTSATTTSEITKPNIYNDEFASNYMVGNLGMLDVDCSTWFGDNVLYVNLINFMPLTSITTLLFDKAYVARQYESFADLAESAPMAWRGYAVSELAIVDSATAWDQAQDLVSYEMDSALSKSQVLYWISSLQGFEINQSDDNNTDYNDSQDSSGDASCANNQGCAILGLSGLCCPTMDGTVLGCCT